MQDIYLIISGLNRLPLLDESKRIYAQNRGVFSQLLDFTDY